MSANKPKFYSSDGSSKKVFVLNPPTGYVYITSKIKNTPAYDALYKEKKYTHRLHEMYPDIVANALNIDSETNKHNLNILQEVIPNDKILFKKPLVRLVDEKTPGLYLQMCKIIDKLADRGFCFLDMKPENVGLLDIQYGNIESLVVIDPEVKFLFQVPEEYMEYFRECGKLIALYNIMGTDLSKSMLWTGLTPDKLQEQFSLGLDFLLATDLTTEQKKEIVDLNRYEISDGVKLEFPHSVISFYGNQAIRDIKKANPKEVFPYSEYKYQLNIPLEYLGLKLDLNTYKKYRQSVDREQIRKKELANYKEFVMSKTVRPQNITRNRRSSRNRNRSSSRNRNRSSRPRNSNSRFNERGFFSGLNALKNTARRVVGPHAYEGFRF